MIERILVWAGRSNSVLVRLAAVLFLGPLIAITLVSEQGRREFCEMMDRVEEELRDD